MNSIISINTRSLRNLEHFQFIDDGIQLIKKYHATTLGIEDLSKELIRLHTEEDARLRVDQSSKHTDEIAEADEKRDNLWQAIHLVVEGMMLSPEAKESSAAERIKRSLAISGDPRNLNHNAESAALSSLTEELLEEEKRADLETMHISNWVVALKEANEAFIKAQALRTEELAVRDSGNVTEIRKTLDPVYRQIVKNINAMAMLGIARPETADFIAELNEKIQEYNTILKSRKAKSKSESTH